MEQQKNYQTPDECDETITQSNGEECDATSSDTTPDELPKPEIELPDERDGAELIPPVTPRTPDAPPHAPVTPQPPAKYCWRYDEQQAHDNNKRRKNSGVLTYAIIMTIAFAVCFMALAGIIMYENGTLTPGIIRTIFVREYDSESGVLTIPEIAEKVRPSVVFVRVTTESGAAGGGTGIILSSDGYIATNYHVVAEAAECSVVLWNNKEYSITYIGGDELSDLALIKIEETGLVAAELGDSDELIVGELAVAVGYPGGLDFAGTTTEGIISGINRDFKVYDDEGIMVKRLTYIQTSAAMSPGNSGGPLVNDRGQVIGIISRKLTGLYDGIGFAIPINGAKVILSDLKTYGSAQDSSGVANKRAILGITAGGVEEGDEYELGDGTIVVAEISGVMITSVSEGYGAEGKLEMGDIIVEVDGIKTSTIYDVMGIANNKRAGDTLRVKFYRDGAYSTVDIVLMPEQ